MPKASMTNEKKVLTQEIVEEELINQEDDLEDDSDDVSQTDSTINIEDLDPELEIWENGPKAKQIVDWKNKYGDVYVTSVTFDKHVVWRTLNRNEYKMIVRQIEQVLASGKMSQTEANMLNEELVCQFCTLFPQFSPEDFSKDLAGLPSILAQQILESSGFTTVDVRQL